MMRRERRNVKDIAVRLFRYGTGGLHLLPSIDEPLLYGRDAFFLFHPLFDSRHLIAPKSINNARLFPLNWRSRLEVFGFGRSGEWNGRGTLLYNLAQCRVQFLYRSGCALCVAKDTWSGL